MLIQQEIPVILSTFQGQTLLLALINRITKVFLRGSDSMVKCQNGDWPAVCLPT